MPIISIKNSDEFLNRYNGLKIFIDGSKIGTIANRETKDFTVTKEKHSIKVKINWLCSSKEYIMDIERDKTIQVLYSKTMKLLWIIPFVITIFFSVFSVVYEQFNENYVDIIWGGFCLGICIIFIIMRNKYLLLIETNNKS